MKFLLHVVKNDFFYLLEAVCSPNISLYFTVFPFFFVFLGKLVSCKESRSLTATNDKAITKLIILLCKTSISWSHINKFARHWNFSTMCRVIVWFIKQCSQPWSLSTLWIVGLASWISCTLLICFIIKKS